MRKHFQKFFRNLGNRFHHVNPIVAGTLVGTSMSRPTFHQSPTFQGIPVAGTLLIHQAIPYFQKQFPKLEISGVFAPGDEFHEYTETGKTFGLYPTGCQVVIPVYEKLSQEEEERLGKALLKKPVVGVMVISGDCKAGCATSSLRSIKIYRLNASKQPDYDRPVWIWNK